MQIIGCLIKEPTLLLDPKVNINDVPQRPTNEVKVFNLKQFVDEKIKKNQNNLLNFSGGGALPYNSGRNPFMSDFNDPFRDPFAPKPMNGFNDPFPPKPMMNDFNDPFMPKPKDIKPFNVDDIVKKIDAKIAELEKQEEDEKKKKRLEATTSMDLNLNSVINSPKLQEENKNNLSELINKKPTDKKETDDDYFDDFFDE